MSDGHDRKPVAKVTGKGTASVAGDGNPKELATRKAKEPAGNQFGRTVYSKKGRKKD